MRGTLLIVALLATPLSAGNTFFVTFPVQAPADAAGQDAQATASAGVTILRHHIPGEPAFQMAGPDGPDKGRIFTAPGQGSYVLTDAGSQWTTAVNPLQTVLAVVETFAGQFGWDGKAYAGAAQGLISKADIAAARLSLGPVLMAELPAPGLRAADEQSIHVHWPGLVESSGLAAELVLWRQEAGSSWQLLAVLSTNSIDFKDENVFPQSSYRYGLGLRYPWPGGGQFGALPAETGYYTTLARSEGAWLKASPEQPTPTPLPTLAGAIPTPDLGAESWVAYPNPNRDGKLRLAFRMTKKGEYKAYIFSLEGALVHKLEGKAEAGAWPMPIADLSRMATGIYLVQLRLNYPGDNEVILPMRKVALIR